MYQLTVSPFGPHQRYTFSHPDNGSAFSIVPAAGANVLDLHFKGKNILDGYDSPEALEAGKWGKSTILFPFPNRLRDGHYHWEGQDYAFPINNAATQNAIHGFVRDETFEVDKVELTRGHAAILCSLRYEGGLAYYPFPFFLELSFVLTANTFSLKVKCLNLHRQAIPVGFGWHPYFRLTASADDHRMQLPPAQKVEIDARMIPTGARSDYAGFASKKHVGDTFLDNCFAATRAGTYKMTLQHGDTALQMSANSSSCPFFQVFTPPHRESIALEPMSCNVDAFHNGEGLVRLEPGKSWQTAMKIAVK